MSKGVRSEVTERIKEKKNKGKEEAMADKGREIRIKNLSKLLLYHCISKTLL